MKIITTEEEVIELIKDQQLRIDATNFLNIVRETSDDFEYTYGGIVLFNDEDSKNLLDTDIKIKMESYDPITFCFVNLSVESLKTHAEKVSIYNGYTTYLVIYNDDGSGILFIKEGN